MASESSTQMAYVVSRERLTLTLALPFLMLFMASVVAWPWQAMGLPMAGTLAPPSAIFLAAAVAGSLYALRRKIPMAMLTWVPAGQGAIAILGTGFMPPGVDPFIGLIIIMAAYSIVFLLLLGLAVAISTHGTHLAVAMVAFFVLTQVTRFPVLEAEPEPMTGAFLLTFAAATRALLEIGALVWLATQLVTSPPDQAKRWAWAIVGLTLAHGLFASWEDPLRLGELTFAHVASRALWWVMLATIPLGMVTVLARLRNSWSRDAEPAPEPQEVPPSLPSSTDEDAAAVENEFRPVRRQRTSGRPTPRKRRRR